MLKIKPPDYQFCPFCAKKLQMRIEEGKERKYCTSCCWTYYPRVAQGISAVIIKKGKVLLVKRKREPFKGTWMFPGGFMDFGEHPLETLKREIKEETGLKIKKAKLIDILKTKNDPRDVYLAFFYETEVFDGPLKNDDEENEKIDWFDIQKPPKMGFDTNLKIMKLLQKGGKK